MTPVSTFPKLAIPPKVCAGLNKTIFFKIRADYYNAYENIKKYFAYRDSIVSENTKTDIAELKTKYDTEKKDRQIVQLNTSQKIKQLEIEKQKAVINNKKAENNFFDIVYKSESKDTKI